MIVYGDNIYRTTDQVLYYGSNRIAKVYYGDSLIYPEPSGSGHYEYITIPAGNKKITYEPKYSGDTYIKYVTDSVITLDESIRVPRYTNGQVSTGNYDLMNGLVSRPDGKFDEWDSLINKYTGRDLLYMPELRISEITKKEDDYDTQVESLREVYRYINDVRMSASYRTSTDVEALIGTITDAIVNFDYYISGSKLSADIRLTSLVNMDFNQESICDAIDSTYSSPRVDRTIPIKFGVYSNTCIVSINNTDYLFKKMGSGGFQEFNQFIKLISEEGDVIYVPTQDSMDHYEKVFKEIPSSNSYINIDADILMNYNPITTTLSESKTIRTKITEYDEYGEPIE